MTLDLKDIALLPQVEPLVAQLVADGPGLIVVAGLDPRPLAAPTTTTGLLPSGRSTFFRILMRRILTADPQAQAAIVAQDRDSLRVPRPLRRRVALTQPEEANSYAQLIAAAASCRPDLLVIDQLTTGTAPAALEAARSGLRVLSQLDTIFRGAGAARQLLDLGGSAERPGGLGWIVAVQRRPTLCPRCKEPAPPDPAQLAELHLHHPDLDTRLSTGTFYRARGCAACHHTGRDGEVTALDIFRAGPADLSQQPSLLSLEEYMLALAAEGYLPLDDVLHLEGDLLWHTCALLTASERALADANATLRLKLGELEAANSVLQQRTDALVSLQGIGQALITSTSLHELASRLCRQAGDLCGAERVILYLLRPEEGTAEVLSLCGWDPAWVHQPVQAHLLFKEDVGSRPAPFSGWPPGVPRRLTDVTASALRAGLWVPLIAQDSQVGLMIVHTSQKSRFAPGEVALLQTFANQAALAIQRAGLTEALQDKVVQLEAAQAELVQKERMERELELARQVQQSVLPRVFPMVPGYAFAARNEPARQVGGDFYDVVLLDAQRFGLVIGDVSDKGMPAALYMALTRSLLLAEARRAAAPRDVLLNVHRLLTELGQPHMFVTVFYGVVDGPSRQLTYARAGHDRPLLFREGRIQPLGGEGTFLGFPGLDDLHLTEEHLDLAPGDRLFLYTDGLTDTLAPNGRPFGLSRLLSLLEAHADRSPADLCTSILAQLAAYQGAVEQYDDTTILVLEVQAGR
jgi:serine phosphatase RsbU (regulator of sigma subunit)